MKTSLYCAALLVFLGQLCLAQEASVHGTVKVLAARGDSTSSEVVVWLTNLVEKETAPPGQIVRLLQKDKRFTPHLLVITIGTPVEFPNHDPFFHNVFSLFEGKRFDLGLYEAGTSHIVHFDKPGVSYIFCNIHPEMSAVVLALDTPFFAVSDSKGEVAIPGVSPGRYVLRIWHERATPNTLKSLGREVTVSEDSRSFGVLRVVETTALNLGHKNKYGQDYIRPSPSSPAYPRL